MPYIPLSKISIKHTTGGLLKFASNGKSYAGPYIKVNNGKYYAGTSNTSIGPELVLDTISHVEGDKPFGSTKEVLKYSLLKKDIRKFLEDIKPVPVVKNTPTELDYEAGVYKRFFSKRINGNNYLEIDRDTYNSIIKKDGKYDHNLYNVGAINWYITGNDVHRQNSLEIKRTEINFPNIFYLFPVLNEFLQPSTEVQENLYTNGGELYYGDSTEYIGPYHVHPLQGPMVGATHVTSPHPKLYYFNQLPQIGDSSYEDFLANYNQITCYKCITVGYQSATAGPDNTSGNFPIKEVVSITRSRLLGCPKNSYFSFDEAHNACFPPPLPEEEPELGLGGERPETPEGGTPNTGFYATFPNDPFGGDYSGFDMPPDTTNPFDSGFFGGGSGGVTGTGLGNIPDTAGSGFAGNTNFSEGTGYNCFTANTLVTMADGTEKTISSIKVGEKVKSEIGESTVLEIQIHDEGDYEVYSINGSKPFVTEEHPFKTIDGWKAIDPFLTFEKHQISSNALNLQDIVYKIDGKEVINSIELGSVKYPKVYNLSLDNEHVYYANGYLVHNNKGAGNSNSSLSDNPNDYNFDIGDGTLYHY
jgi:hypothetical protein